MACDISNTSVQSLILGSAGVAAVVTLVGTILTGKWQSKAAREAGVAQAIETEKLRLRNAIADRHLDSFHHHADGFRADLMEMTSNKAQEVLDGISHTPMNIVFDAELATARHDWRLAEGIADDFTRQCDQIARWLRESGTERNAWTDAAYRAITAHRLAALDALSHLIRMVNLSNDARIAGMDAADTRGSLQAMADHWAGRKELYP